MFILKSKHDAAIAAKDAEIASLIKGYQSQVRINKGLDAQLARYTAPRERGEGGRFLPLKRVS